MIANRSQGLQIMSHAFVVIYMMALFFLMLLVGIHLLESLNYKQVNIPLYTLAVFVAGLLAHSSDQYAERSKLTSFRWVGAIRQTNYQSAILALVLFAIIFATKDRAISRLFIGSFLLIFWLSAIPLNRYLSEWIARIVFRGQHSVRAVFLGSAKSAKRLEDWTERQPFLGIELIGLVSYELVTDSDLKMPVVGDFMDLPEIIDTQKIDQVVLLETRDSDWWVDSVVEICNKAGCHILIYNPWEKFFEQNLLPAHQEGHTFFSLQPEPLENPLNRMVKRLMDICIALPVVIFILPWLCVWVKLMQALQAPGPMLFRQERSGQRGRPFTIYKFRSMHETGNDHSRECEQAQKGDDRTFAFGRFMRRTSIDEFPQFLNVLKGEMSAIGPRPHLMQHDVAFGAQVNVYRTRQFVRPGITGLAQCRGFRGEITDPKLIEQRVRSDLEYIQDWSFWLDLLIAIRTTAQLMRPPKSAY